MAPHGNAVFPILQSCTRLGTDQTIHDVQFWPYGTIDDDQIFAVTGGTDTVICRPRLGADPPFEVLRWFRDEVAQDNDRLLLNSLVWMQDPATKNPWLCVAGEFTLHIKILDIASGKVVRILSGHGGGILDLCISPTSSNLLASCSNDSTIRLWNVEPSCEEQPCVALFAGEGHKASVQTIKFHPNGKWLLSGGIDTAVCLWAVPTADVLKERDHSRTSKPLTVYYPHFFTKELHPNYVDSSAWYGDYIISKAGRDQNNAANGRFCNEILLWKISGFDANAPPPEEPPIPEPGYFTRSSFPHDKELRGFARVLTFDIPHNDRFYHRFGLLYTKGMRPILCMGDQKSRYSFWDLQRLEEGIDPSERAAMMPKKKMARKKGVPDVLNGLPETTRTMTSSSPTAADREFTLSDCFTPLAPHYQVTASTELTRSRPFATSQIAWSPDGRWMVTVGDLGMICMWHRDGSVV